MAEYSSTGAHLWSQGYGGIIGDQALGIAVDSSNDIVATGNIGYNVNFGGGWLYATGYTTPFVVKLSTGEAAPSPTSTPTRTPTWTRGSHRDVHSGSANLDENLHPDRHGHQDADSVQHRDADMDLDSDPHQRTPTSTPEPARRRRPSHVLQRGSAGAIRERGLPRTARPDDRDAVFRRLLGHGSAAGRVVDRAGQGRRLRLRHQRARCCLRPPGGHR